MAILVVASVLNIGVHGTNAFINRIAYADHHPAVFEVWKTLTVPGATHTAAWTALLDALVVVLVAGAAWRSRNGDLRLPLAAALIGSLLIAPYEHSNDLILLTVAAWLLTGLAPTRRGALLAAASLVVLAYDTPTTSIRWGYLMMALEGLWLVSLYASTTAGGPLRLVASVRDSRRNLANYLAESRANVALTPEP